MADRTDRMHYVPACYLKHWATPNTREGAIGVFDRETGRPWQSKPESVAFQRGFYLVDLPDDPLAVEEALGQLERTVFDPALVAVNRDGVIPSDDEMRPLLAFIAIQAIRTPRHRSQQAAVYSDLHLFALREFVDDERAFAKAVRKVTPNASDEYVAKELANARELLANPSAHVDVGHTQLIGDALDLAKELEDLLYQRWWQLIVAPEGANFVTCDEPVMLDFVDVQPRSPWNSPGFGREDTLVSVPLGPRHALVGRYSEPATRCKVISRKGVASFNTRVAFGAERFVYFAGNAFEFVDPDDPESGTVRGPHDLLRRAQGRADR